MANVCPTCGKSFSKQFNLRRHVKNATCQPPTEGDPVKCPICNKDFRDMSTMESHSVTQHPKCGYCNKRFSHKKNLKVHLDNKTCQEREVGDLVNCPICNKGYPDDNRMEAHYTTEHPTCLHCNKSFRCKRNLKVHLNNKTCQVRGDKEVPCPVCRKLYASKEGMLRHFRSKHPEDAPKKRAYRVTDISEFKCCGQKFTNGRALGRHRDQVHYRKINDGTGRNNDKLKPIEPTIKNICYVCGKGFPSSLTLLRHEMEDHGEPGPSTSGANEIETNEQEKDPYSDVKSQSDESQQSESDDDDDENPTDEPKNPLDDPSSLFQRIGVPMVDKAGRKTFNTTRYRWSFGLTKTAIDLFEEGLGMEVLHAVIKELFKKISKKRGRIQIKLMSDYLDYPIAIPLFQISYFNPLVLLNYIGLVLSSKDRLAIDQPLTIEVTHVGEMEGGGVALNPMTFGDFLRRRNGCWDPGNVGEDYRCLTYCLAAWILIQKKWESGKKFKTAKFYKDPTTSRDMLTLCKELSEKAEVDMDKQCGVAELEKYQQVFCEDYDSRLVVHDWQKNYNKLYFGEPHRTKMRQIHLLYFNQHFILIYNFSAFIGSRKRYCQRCVKVYDSRYEHSCEFVCPRCLREGCPALKVENCDTHFECNECNISFKNFHCYLAHKGSQEVCMTKRYLCVKCNSIVKVNPNKEHVCHKGVRCPHCHQEVDPITHLCLVEEPSESTRLGTEEYHVIYFDIETSTEPDGRLVPYLIICAVNCEKCTDVDTENCENCGPRYRMWYGWECVNEFGDWLSSENRFEKKRTILTAHNSAKFDGYFIYLYAAKRGVKPRLQFKNNDLLSLTWKKIQMKDSLQFLKCALDKLPTILGFEGAKGFFAWKLVNRCPTLQYRGKIPSPSDFGIERMTNDKREKFWEYYRPLEADPDYEYDLEEEAKKYCLMDVKILESSWKLFRKSCLKLTEGQLDPLIGKQFTLAAFSAAIYKTMFMTHEIGIIPWGGYRNPKRLGQSLLGCAYLDYLNERRECDGLQPLICATNSPREARVAGYNVDALDLQTGDVYEVLGCYYHAHAFTPLDCKWKLRDEKHPTRTPMTFGDVNREMNSRLYQIRRTRRKVIPIWECQIEKMKREDPDLATYFKREDVARKYHKPLDPADAVYGGRVEAFKLRVTLTEEQIREGWTIEYIDFCSLYPYVQWAFEYGTESHPEVVVDRDRLDNLVEDADALNDFLEDNFGLCSCKVLAPEKLRFAVLPYRARLKTLFALCRTCAEEDSDSYCRHSDEERSFKGVYTFYELKLALDRGYKVLSIYEIWDYGEEKDKIFAEYVTKMMVMKTRHSEVPEDMSTEEFCDLWNLRVPGMNLNPEDMNANQAMRLTAKILLNSLWGKFCEKAPAHNTKILNSCYDLQSTLDDETSVLTQVEKVTERSLVATCKKKDEFIRETSMYNPVLGAYVTAYARTTLLEKCLEVVGDRALYVDTDSLVYLSKPGLPTPPRGEALGQLANELKPGQYGVCFQCYAPKSWRLEVEKNGLPANVIIKTKGLHLTALGSSIKTAIDRRRLWDDLIDMRLVEEGGTAARCSIQEFYEQLGDDEVPEELVQPCLEAFAQQQWERAGLRSDKDAPGLIVPQPTLKRDRMSGFLKDARFNRKLARFRYDKGLLLNTNPNWPENEVSTRPYGYKEN